AIYEIVENIRKNLINADVKKPYLSNHSQRTFNRFKNRDSLPLLMPPTWSWHASDANSMGKFPNNLPKKILDRNL
ncbi:2267_t:CDS:2, partial [Racocetra persica]